MAHLYTHVHEKYTCFNSQNHLCGVEHVFWATMLWVCFKLPFCFLTIPGTLGLFMMEVKFV